MTPMLRVFVSRRMAAVLLLGFSSGLPMALTGQALQAWMVQAKMDLTVIGFFSLVTLPYALKFLWSPLMDRFVPPLLGRRRGWMLLTQLAVAAAIVAMAATGVTGSPLVIASLALVLAFCSASQDIAIDAYRTDLLASEETGAGAALAIMGWRGGFIVSGGLSLVLADHLPWSAVYIAMAGGMAVGAVTTLLAPEPPTIRPPRSLTEAVKLPFVEFLRRRGSVEMLLFILIYKLDWAMVYLMSIPFLTALGFTGTEIGAINQGLGVAATIAGALAGGAVQARIGVRRSLWIFGLLQGLAGLSFMTLAMMGKNYPMMVTAVVVENACSGMATAAFTGFIMSLCDKRFTATQFALLSSLMALGRTVGGTPTGWLAQCAGWPLYFAASVLIAIPGLLLLLRYDKWQTAGEDTAGGHRAASVSERTAKV